MKRRVGVLRSVRTLPRRVGASCCVASFVVCVLMLLLTALWWWERRVGGLKLRVHVAPSNNAVSVNQRSADRATPAVPVSCHGADIVVYDAEDDDNGGGVGGVRSSVQPPASGTVQCRSVTSLRLPLTCATARNGSVTANIDAKAEATVVDTVLHLRNHFRSPENGAASGRATKSIMLHSWEGFFGSWAANRMPVAFGVGLSGFGWLTELLPSFQRGEWLFATNNNGRHFSNKQVSRNGVAERRVFAERAVQKAQRVDGVFVYTKWELPRDHPVHLAARADVDSEAFRCVVAALTMDTRVIGWERLVSAALQRVDANVSEAYLRSLSRRARGATSFVRGATSSEDDAARKLDQLVLRARREFVDHATLGDFFVSLYHAGDFLTSHTDDSLGSVAVVGHFAVVRQLDATTMASHGTELGGGETSFFCADLNNFCVTMNVSQDSLMVFPTRPYLVSHKVHRNINPALFRFGFTGWFALAGERQVVAY